MKNVPTEKNIYFPYNSTVVRPCVTLIKKN